MKCPNCSGTLYYNITDKNLKCRHCSSVFNVDDYKERNIAEETSLEDARLFICQNCGAELISENDEAVSYCSYCGSEAMLESNMSGIKKPKKIIPFRISKQQCKNIYEQKLKNVIYVPKEMKDPGFIDRFRPFYIPYWMYRISFRTDSFELDGTKSYTKKGYDYYEEYKVKTQVNNNGIYGIPYDASRNFDDTIAEEIAPFNKKDITDFKPGYLAGMYADSPNVDANTYKEEVMQKASEVAFSDIENKFSGITLKVPRRQKLQEFLQTKYNGEEAIYLPVWFLTWKRNDRVVYAIVNGQTGKIHIDMPVDIRQFLLYTLAGAAVLFVFLTVFVSVTSRFVIWFSALLVYLVSIRYYKELKEIRNRENHVFDKGYLLNDGDKLPMSEKKRARLRAREGFTNSNIIKIIYYVFMSFIVVISFGLIGGLYDELVSQSGAIAMTFIISILQLIRFFRTLNVSRYLRNKRSMLVALIALMAVLYSFGVSSAEPVEDWWYYLGSLICLAAASIMAFDLIFRINESATRPLPSFYVRKGGNDNAKES